MKFFTQYERPEEQGEINSGKVVTEQVGYVPPNVLIENMIFAGQRLDLARTEMYEYKDEEEALQGEIDRSKRKDFDPSEITPMVNGLRMRVAEQKVLFEKEQKARQEKEAAEKAEFEEFKKNKETLLKKGVE